MKHPADIFMNTHTGLARLCATGSVLSVPLDPEALTLAAKERLPKISHRYTCKCCGRPFTAPLPQKWPNVCASCYASDQCNVTEVDYAGEQQAPRLDQSAHLAAENQPNYWRAFPPSSPLAHRRFPAPEISRPNPRR